MDFNLNDEQELFVAGIRELMASENWEAYFAECDRDSIYPERFVKALAEMGIDSLLIGRARWHGRRIRYRCGGMDGIGAFGRADICAVPITGRVQYFPA